MTREPQDTSAEEPDGGNLQVRFRGGPGRGDRPGLLNSRQSLPRVLCVDDEPKIVEGLVLHLRKDYEVHTAQSGQEALKALKEMGGAAVVVSDMRMPGMDGATLLQHVMQFFS